MPLPDAPLILYRGESVLPEARQERVAVVKKFHLTGQGLWTDLVNEGNPYALAELGLLEAVRKHIADPRGFKRTHFLSFSSEERIALGYARTPPVEEDDDTGKASYPDTEWAYTKYVLFKFTITGWASREPGIYRLDYNSGTNVAFVINASEYLGALPAAARKGSKHEDALASAQRDREWLVLPADPIGDGTLSAYLRKGTDLSIDHYVEPAFFTDRPVGFFR